MELDLGADYRELLSFAEQHGGPSVALDSIGLLLVLPPQNYGYDVTPTNVITFANTGGDGTHFSVLLIEGKPGPVVMTVPTMWDDANHVVGENIREFFNLGATFGFFGLDELAFDFDGAVRDIEESTAAPQQTEPLLAHFRKSLGLKPGLMLATDWWN